MTPLDAPPYMPPQEQPKAPSDPHKQPSDTSGLRYKGEEVEGNVPEILTALLEKNPVVIFGEEHYSLTAPDIYKEAITAAKGLQGKDGKPPKILFAMERPVGQEDQALRNVRRASPDRVARNPLTIFRNPELSKGVDIFFFDPRDTEEERSDAYMLDRENTKKVNTQMANNIAGRVKQGGYDYVIVVTGEAHINNFIDKSYDASLDEQLAKILKSNVATVGIRSSRGPTWRKMVYLTGGNFPIESTPPGVFKGTESVSVERVFDIKGEKNDINIVIPYDGRLEDLERIRAIPLAKRKAVAIILSEANIEHTLYTPSGSTETPAQASLPSFSEDRYGLAGDLSRWNFEDVRKTAKQLSDNPETSKRVKMAAQLTDQVATRAQLELALPDDVKKKIEKIKEANEKPGEDNSSVLLPVMPATRTLPGIKR